MDIGKRIRAARRAAGMSQEELARRAGMSLKGMGDIERGDIADPHYSSLAKIAQGLGVPVAELVEEPHPSPKGEAPSPSRTPGEAGRLEEQRKLFGSWWLYLKVQNDYWIKLLEDLPEAPSMEELKCGRQVIDQMFKTIGAVWTGFMNPGISGIYFDMRALVEAESRGIGIPLAFKHEFELLYEELRVLFNHVIPKAREWHTRREDWERVDAQVDEFKRVFAPIMKREPV